VAPIESEPIRSKTFVYALGKGEGIADLEPFKADAYAKELIE
jgi:signal recognition particle GTPase